jgi:mannose-6-phosphate isomerase-like protein (cupin superfamily)
VPFVDPTEMLRGEPVPGWTGHFFHSENMTFLLWDVAADASPLDEHHHAQEEVWNVVEGKLLLTIAGEERLVGPGGAAVVPPGTGHSARVVSASRAVVAYFPLRLQLPGVTKHEPG